MPFYATLDDLVGGAVLGTAPTRLPGVADPVMIVIPAVGASVFLYERGTTTQVDLYSTDDGSGALVSQPVTTDEAGHVVDSSGDAVYAALPALFDMAVSGGNVLSPRTIPCGSLEATGGVTKSVVLGLGILPGDLGVTTLTPVACVATANVALTGLQTIDGRTLTATDHVLLTGQTDATQNGVWVPASGAWARPAEMAHAAVMGARSVEVIQGTSHRGETWLLQTNSMITVDTTAQTWVSQTPVSVAVGTSVSGGDTGLLWNGSAWVSAKTLAAPSGMTAQDLLIAGSGSATARVPVGTAGQMTGIRSDGTVGHMDHVVSLAGWKVGANANLGNGSNDDTAAIQAWAAAVIAKNAKGIAPAPSNSYSISSSVYLGPPPGQTTCSFQMEWQGQVNQSSTNGPGCVKWTGGNGTDGARLAMFSCAGWKRVQIYGLNPNIPTATYVTAFELDNACTTLGANFNSGTTAGTSVQLASTANLSAGQTLTITPGASADTLTIASIIDATHVTFTGAPAHNHLSGDAVQSPFASLSQSSFYDCHVRLAGNQAGVVGWRMGHSDTLANGVDISFLAWHNCEYNAAASTANTGSTRQIAWANEGGNSLNHYWYGGNSYHHDVMISNNPTTGCGSTAGGGSLSINGVGTSGNGGLDFEFVNFGTYKISGGRFENGIQLLAAGGATISEPINVTLDGIECEGYSGASGVLFAMSGSSTLSLLGGYIGATSATAQWTSSMITFSSSSASSQGSLIVRGAHLSAADPFYALSTGNWSLSIRNNTQLTTANAVTAKFHEIEWLGTGGAPGNQFFYYGAGVPGSNSGVQCMLVMGTNGVTSPAGRCRVGYDGTNVGLTDASANLPVYLSSNGNKAVQANPTGRAAVLGLTLTKTVPAVTPYTSLATDSYLAVTTGTAKTINLEAASTAPGGTIKIVKDTTGGAGTNNITVTPAGSDTIEGGSAGAAKALKTAFGCVWLASDGTSNWSIVNQIGTFS